ncbi:hypothetical protein CMQ_3609 [Grosmannia clavigera kw1407]|uniref:Glycosyltransferase family 31 protein n=1 Tax=Grosmannia clavigera (strain kw1407 / UAMH 11150) TaxID=655863 RepID=F0X962_GROCL|nr:uncharacterized protein CMQ_3609 [Grosmannia clavigera kw1407]EFX05540.1 hypothetical protein CMQ_3609 [Grosmannia clavigera kw1407]
MVSAGLWRPRRVLSPSRTQNSGRVRESNYSGKTSRPHMSALVRRICFVPHIVLTQDHVRGLIRCLFGAFVLIGVVFLVADRRSVKAFVDKTAENAKTKLPLYTWAIGAQTSPNPAAPWQDWKEPSWLPSAANGTGVSEEAAYLNYLVYRYGLTPDVPWYARHVRADYVGGQPGNRPGEDDHLRHHDRRARPTRPSLTKVKSKLTPGGFTTVHAEALVPGVDHPDPDTETEDGVWLATDAESEPPVEPAVLRLPMARSARPDQIDASMLLFGISTTYARLSHAGFALVADWARWLTDGCGQSNGAGLLLSLHRAQPDEVKAVARVLQEHGIDARIVIDPGNYDSEATNSTADSHSDMEGNSRPDPPAVRYSNLLPLLRQYDDAWVSEQEAGSPVQRSFYALVDDDVFFPSMDRLLGRLMLYAGAHPHPHGGDDSSSDLWLGFPSTRSDWQTVDLATEAAKAAAARSALFSPPVPPLPSLSRTIAPTSLMVVSYGGGAVFLSPSLAVRMAELPCLRRTTDALHEAVLHAGIAVGKTDAYDGEPWDEHLYHCATSSPSTSTLAEAAVQLRIVPSFYAPFDAAAYDHNGNETDPDNGVRLLQQYAGGLQPLTLHGYRRHDHFSAGFGHRVADVCGEDCFLQRFAFRDGWVLVNGHSLEHHDGLRVEPLRKARLLSLPSPPPTENAGHGSDLVDSLRDWLKSGGRMAVHRTDGHAPEDAADRRRREFQQQQHFWSSKRLIVEDAERPDDLSVVRSRSRQLPAIWRLVDAYVAADGSLWQAYLKRRTATAGSGHGLDATAVPDMAASDQDSVVVLMWENAVQ